MGKAHSVSGNIVDLLNNEIYAGTVEISGTRIAAITKDVGPYGTFILPGLIDSHIHIESSMLVPSEFARHACLHGTVATVSDAHEIANVLGIAGMNYMIENGGLLPFKFYFGAPSCVPATPFETSGAVIGIREIEELLKRDEIKYLAEVMNFPGVLSDDPAVMEKIRAARLLGRKVDGHAPGLRGAAARKYIDAGISTDHECLTLDEAREKLKYGMKLLIREGSAARNFDEFIPLVDEYPEDCMFCSDDLHPDDLFRGHINILVKRALGRGIDRMKVLKCACVNPVLHYGLEVGLLRTGDFADFIVIDNFDTFTVLKTVINGTVVADKGETRMPTVQVKKVNNFRAAKKRVSDFALRKTGETMNVIEAIDGQLITDKLEISPKVDDGYVISEPGRDILKITVVNRYENQPPSLGFIKGFGLKKGALASSVAHDSHNIIAVGVADEDLCEAVNLVIEEKGGLSVVGSGTRDILPLPVAGLMSAEEAHTVAERYAALDARAKDLGSGLKAPFMTLSFMALLVIPKIKLSDRGLFDGERFRFIGLFEMD